MQRLLSWFLALCMVCTLCSGALAAEENGFSHFRSVNDYAEDTFSDVSGWYAPYVNTVYTLGLMQGSEEGGERTFKPNDAILLSEAVTLAARIHSIYTNDGHTFQQRGVWYQTYVDYAVKNGILTSEKEFSSYAQTASRAQFVQILARALPEEGYHTINTIEVGAIPDVDMEQKYSFAVYKLYRAGVLTGSDDRGAFLPGEEIQRCEVAAMAARIVAPVQRQSFSLYAPLYVGFTMDSENQGNVVITGLTMTTAGENCYLTMTFESQSNRFLSIMNASESLYILKVVAIEPGADSVTFTFPMETLEKIYSTSGAPEDETLLMEFYATGSPDSVTDRFYLSIAQFAKYFDAAS